MYSEQIISVLSTLISHTPWPSFIQYQEFLMFLNFLKILLLPWCLKWHLLSLEATFFYFGTWFDQQSTHTTQYSDDRDTLAVFSLLCQCWISHMLSQKFRFFDINAVQLSHSLIILYLVHLFSFSLPNISLGQVSSWIAKTYLRNG